MLPALCRFRNAIALISTVPTTSMTPMRWSSRSAIGKVAPGEVRAALPKGTLTITPEQREQKVRSEGAASAAAALAIRGEETVDAPP